MPENMKVLLCVTFRGCLTKEPNDLIVFYTFFVAD
jgi:hypothetical protein